MAAARSVDRLAGDRVRDPDTNEADRRLTPAPASNPYAKGGPQLFKPPLAASCREACVAQDWRQVVGAESPKQHLVSSPRQPLDGGARRVQPLRRLPDEGGGVVVVLEARERCCGAGMGSRPRHLTTRLQGPGPMRRMLGTSISLAGARHAQPQHPT